MSLTVLVVDDEPLARLGVTARLRSQADLSVVGECSTGQDALESIARLAPDLIFLDIQMPGLSGLEALREVPPKQRPMVIFLTAYDDYAVDAFEVQALDYLLKPVDDRRLEASLDRARRLWHLKKQEGNGEPLQEPGSAGQVKLLQRFAIRRGSEVSFVNALDVEWIEGLGDYAGLHVGTRTHLIRESLTTLAQRLDPSLFLRIHRSSIVRLDRILKIEALLNRDYLLTLHDGSTVRSSRTYSKAVRRLMQHGSE